MNFYDIAKSYSVSKDNKIKRGLKFGRSPALMGTTYEQVWDGGIAYTYNNVVTLLQLSSSSATDDPTKTITLVGLDANYDEITETVTLNGTTAVTTTNQYIRIYRAFLASGATLSGDVYIYVSGSAITAGIPNIATTIRAKILVGNNQSQMSMISVPRGYSMLITWTHSAVVANTANISCRMRTIGVSGALDSNAFRVVYEFDQGAVNIQLTPDPPMVIPEKSDFEVGAAFSTGTTNTMTVNFGYYLVPNSS
jgi:hypothetical protein